MVIIASGFTPTAGAGSMSPTGSVSTYLVTQQNKFNCLLEGPSGVGISHIWKDAPNPNLRFIST